MADCSDGNRSRTGGSPFDALPECLLGAILLCLPHASRLQSRCVCPAWNRTVSALEAATPAGPAWCLAVEQLNGDEGLGPKDTIHCFTVRPGSGENVPLPATFPPGWSPAAHGGIRGGGRSGLMAFFDYNGSPGQYWVGNPVHDQWEKVLEPPPFQRLPFGRQRFEFVTEEGSGFFKIVQFQMNEYLAPPSTSKVVRQHTNFLIQVYCSRSRTWKVAAKQDELVFNKMNQFCLLDRTVFFIGSVDGPLVQIWGFHVDHETLTPVTPPARWPHRHILPYFTSLQLVHDSDQGVKMLLVGHQRAGTNLNAKDRLYEIRCNPDTRRWVVERELMLDYAGNDDTEQESWGLHFVAYNQDEVYEIPDVIQETTIFYHDEEVKKWCAWYVDSPISAWGELSSATFLPCACCRLFSETSAETSHNLDGEMSS